MDKPLSASTRKMLSALTGTLGVGVVAGALRDATGSDVRSWTDGKTVPSHDQLKRLELLGSCFNTIATKRGAAAAINWCRNDDNMKLIRTGKVRAARLSAASAANRTTPHKHGR